MPTTAAEQSGTNGVGAQTVAATFPVTPAAATSAAAVPPHTPSQHAPGHDLSDHAAQQQPVLASSRTGLVYNSLMLLHQHPSEPHPESPLRIAHIFALLKTSGYLAQMTRVVSREAKRSEIRRVHTEAVVSGVYQSALLPAEVLHDRASDLERDSSLYLNPSSALCARLSAGSLVELCDAVVSGRLANGFAIIRPPGHHAEPNRSMGFCLFNNVAIAVRAMQDRYPAGDKAVKRVMILDWDVHHGNGTQAVFNNDRSVLYVSLHRYDDGTFYPGGPFGSAESVGSGSGRGFSVNIPWVTYGMGDGDYLAAFDRIIMPIAAEYGPDLVFISAGFDAAKGDPLGLNLVTPTGYAHMTSRLAQLAGGRLVVALEGGYNVDAIAPSALAVIRVLLGEAPPPLPRGTTACPSARRTCEHVRRIHSQFWTNLVDPDQVLSNSSSPTCLPSSGAGSRSSTPLASSGPAREPGPLVKRIRVIGPNPTGQNRGRRNNSPAIPPPIAPGLVWTKPPPPALGLPASDAHVLSLWRENAFWVQYQLTPLPLPEIPAYVSHLATTLDTGEKATDPATINGTYSTTPANVASDASCSDTPILGLRSSINSSWPTPSRANEPSKRQRTLLPCNTAPLVHAMVPHDLFSYSSTHQHQDKLGDNSTQSDIPEKAQYAPGPSSSGALAGEGESTVGGERDLAEWPKAEVGYRAALLYVHDAGVYRSSVPSPSSELGIDMGGAPLDRMGGWDFGLLPVSERQEDITTLAGAQGYDQSSLSDLSDLSQQGDQVGEQHASAPPALTPTGFTSLHSWARANRVAVIDVCALVSPVLSPPPPQRPHSESYTGMAKDLASHWANYSTHKKNEVPRANTSAQAATTTASSTSPPDPAGTSDLPAESDSTSAPPPLPEVSVQDAITLGTIAAYDRTLSLLPHLPRILVGFGSAGVDAIMGLLAARGQKNVRAVVQVPGMGTLPHTPGGNTVAAHLPRFGRQHVPFSHTDHLARGKVQSEALKQFYSTRSLVLLPQAHPAHPPSLGVRYGRLVRSAEPSPLRVLGREMGSVTAFLENSLVHDGELKPPKTTTTANTADTAKAIVPPAISKQSASVRPEDLTDTGFVSSAQINPPSFALGSHPSLPPNSRAQQ